MSAAPMFAQVFSIIAPVFICAAIGFIWVKLGRSYDVDQVTTLVTNIGAPCLVFQTLANIKLDGNALAAMGGATLAALCVCLVLASTILRLAGLSQRSFLPALIFPNSGNMGLPLCYLAFGDTGLAMAITVFAVYCAAQFTLGISLASGRLSLPALARVPLLYAVPLALGFWLSGTAPPAWINATTRLLGNLTIPMMLITLGVSLASLSVSRLPRGLALAATRLVMGFAVGFGLATILGFSGVARGVLIVQTTMPVAVFNYLFAERYRTAPAEVAGMVVLSTVMSFATLPALLWYVL